MKKDKDSIISIITTAVMLVSYAAQRLFGFYIQPTKQSVIILAMLNTVLLLAVTLVLLKRENVFFALLSALIGFKMLPVGIPALYSFSKDADMLYFVVGKAAMVIFAFVAYRLYRRQEEPKAIKPLPIIALMFSVPFFSDIAARFVSFFHDKTGSMLYGYFAQYACYIAASFVILGIAYASGYESMRFAAYFEYAALSINIIRVAGKVVLFMSASEHVSKSLYGWLIIYVALIICFILVKNIKKKKEC